MGVLHTSSYGAIIAYVFTLISFQIFKLRWYQRALSLVGVATVLTLTFSNITFDPFDSSKKVTQVSESILIQTNNLSGSTDKGRPLITPRNDMISSASDRISIAKNSLNALASKGFWGFMFGSGSSAAETVLKLPSSDSTSSFVPHNAFISFIKSYGVVPLSLLLAIIVTSLLRARRNQNLRAMIPFFPVWIASLFIDLQFTYLFIIFMISLSNFWVIAPSESRFIHERKDL
jgi:hypothetical protein